MPPSTITKYIPPQLRPRADRTAQIPPRHDTPTSYSSYKPALLHSRRSQQRNAGHAHSKTKENGLFARSARGEATRLKCVKQIFSLPTILIKKNYSDKPKNLTTAESL